MVQLWRQKIQMFNYQWVRKIRIYSAQIYKHFLANNCQCIYIILLYSEHEDWGRYLILDLPRCASHCWNQSLRQFLFWRCQEHPEHVTFAKFSRWQMAKKLLPSKWFRSEKWHHRTERWRVDPLIHHCWVCRHHWFERIFVWWDPTDWELALSHLQACLFQLRKSLIK